MSDMIVAPDALRAYGATSAALGTALGSAGSINAAANTAAMIPVFGVIGQEFLAAFIAAQANHLRSVGELAAVHAGTAAAALTGGGDYETVDADGAARVAATRAGMAHTPGTIGSDR